MSRSKASDDEQADLGLLPDAPEPEAEAPEAAIEDSIEEAATDETPVLLPRAHPSAARGPIPAPPEGVEPEFYIGQWGPRPLWGCPYCVYSTIESSGVVELHILSKIDAGDFPHRAALEPKE